MVDDITIWLITGRIAALALQHAVEKFNGVEVVVAPVPVAAFLTRDHVVAILASNPGMRGGVVVVPGKVAWDVTRAAEDLGIVLVKGPDSVLDMPPVLRLIERAMADMGTVTAGDVAAVIERGHHAARPGLAEMDAIVSERVAAIVSAEGGAGQSELHHDGNAGVEEMLQNRARNFTIPYTTRAIGKDLPPLVMAEITRTPDRSLDDVERLAGYFLRQGADILDVGSISGKPNPKAMAEAVERIIQQHPGCLVSIDSMNGKEVLAAVDRGARIVLSIDEATINILGSLDPDVTVVVVPGNAVLGTFPADPVARANDLANLVGQVHEAGFMRVIADPVLESPIRPGLVPSLEGYTYFSRLCKDRPEIDVPIFLGGSNVSEMIDADSAGVNAILAVLGVELGAGILFTTEESAKCTGSVAEMKAARDLAFLAGTQQAVPKDLGIDALSCKKKHRAIPSFNQQDAGSTIDTELPSLAKATYKPDPAGIYFKINIDHDEGIISAGAFRGEEFVVVFTGTSAETIGRAIINHYPALAKDHILYLGRELERAEYCLFHHASFIQDES
jgi:dihydropteroate synthase-like protein